jgi:hypothetical protein
MKVVEEQRDPIIWECTEQAADGSPLYQKRRYSVTLTAYDGDCFADFTIEVELVEKNAALDDWYSAVAVEASYRSVCDRRWVMVSNLTPLLRVA